MSLWKKILLGIGMCLAFVVGLFLVFVGPWPTYASGFEAKGYFRKAIAAIDQNVRESDITDAPGRLEAGWGVNLITPKPGTPMAGYGDRGGAPSEGVHDDLYVKALALSDGQDVAVLVGSDMLLVPENVAAMVREEVAREVPLTPNDIFFCASHTHGGPGAFGPGLVARIASGKYDPEIPIFLTQAFTSAIVKAYNGLEPAKLAHGGVNAEQYIKNRTRKAPVDGELSYLVVEQDDGDRCYLASFSAHPTVLGGKSNMQMTAEYPGYLQRAIERDTGATAVYLGGAVGSMGHRAPDGPNGFARAEAMGEALAKLVLEDATDPAFETNLDVVSVGVPLKLPPFQVRIMSPKWRFSKFLVPLAGINTSGWTHAVRVGDVVFVGVPADFSGEISVKWKKWAERKGYDMWATSFSADYVGYISPDEYYQEVTDAKGGPKYETGLMSWCGPHQEAYFTALMNHMVEVMAPRSKQAFLAPPSPLARAATGL